MSLISGRVHDRKAIVDVVLSDFDPGLALMGSAAGLATYRGLIDTGASISSVSRSIVFGRRLVRRGKIDVDSASGQFRHGLYLVSLGFVTNSEERGRGVFMLDEPVEVIDVPDNNAFDIIVGMDVLERCDLELKRSGAFRLRL
jgi:hypothetical protein